ncbi:MAG: dipeptidase [Rhizobiaceae bacterium]|nr:dipeptidase [Rhizobiaceae bacterium]
MTDFAKMARDIHADSIVVVGHTDLVASNVDWRREVGERNVLDRHHLPTLRAGGATVVCDHIAGDGPYGYLPATRLTTDFLQRAMRALDHTHAELEESTDFILATSAEDIRRAKRDGKIAYVICFEGASPLQNEISYLRNFYRLGLRCLGLTHDLRNEVADGIRERSGAGLTHFGVNVVRECNRLGILVDVSHLSDKGTEDVLEISSDPITASHSNARALCDVPRNLPDDLIRRIGRSGGVIGFHALHYLVTKKETSTLDDVLRQIAHIAEVGGPECIGIGPDLMEDWWSPIVENTWEKSTTINGIPYIKVKFQYPKGMESNAELPNVTEGLLRMGFSEAEVRNFLGGNFMRLFERVWKPAAGATA